MGTQVSQGTRWESRIVAGALLADRRATRLAKTGTKHEADVRIGGKNKRPVIAWERGVGKKIDGRRRAVRMVVITEQHFYELLDKDTFAEYGYWMQNKSTQNLNLSETMEGLEQWIENNKNE